MVLANGVVMRSSALLAEGIYPQAIANALKAGVIVKAARGAYQLSRNGPEAALAHIAAACLRMPKAVICLTSAAYLAGLRDDLPAPGWLALPTKTHAVKPGDLAPRIMRWSVEGAFERGIIEDEICGVRVRRTSPERTVVDLIRYARHFRDEDPGIEAGRRLFARGGSGAEVLSIASDLRTPAPAMKTIDILVRAAARSVP